MGHRYPQPDNEDGFEQLCLRFYRKLWKNEALKLYAKRGEKQDGVDIFDPFLISPVRAVQCKFHEETKTIPPSEIKAEVEKAEGSRFEIEQFIIATTAKKSRNAQDTVADLNKRQDKKFFVDIQFWEDICHDVSQLGPIEAELIIYGEHILAGAKSILAGSTNFISSPETEPLPSDIGKSLAKIEQLLDEREFDAARKAMEDRPDIESAKSLPAQDQYLLLRFRGRIAMADCKWKPAGQMFIDAYDIAPESDQAKQNHVLGLSLLGKVDEAYAAAVEHIRSGVKTNAMITRLIDCIKTTDQLAEHTDLFATFTGSDVDVNLALCHKHLELRAFDDARVYAEKALELKADSPHAHLAAAMVLHRSSVELDWAERSQQLQTAIKHYETAEQEARSQKFLQLLPEIIVNRAAAHMLLGNEDKAANDYRLAVQVAQNVGPYAARAVEFFLEIENYSAAWEQLYDLDQSTPEGQYLALVVEYHYGDAESKLAAIDKMKSLADSASEREVDCRSFCVQWSLIGKDFEKAIECVPLSFQESHPFQAHTLLAWINLQKSDNKTARLHADKALEASVENAHRQDLRLLGYMLIQLGDDKNALGLLEQVARPGVLDEEMKRLIECAQRLERHDLLLRLCEELRDNRQQDFKIQVLELQLLNLYAPEDALQLTTTLIEQNPNPAYFVAFRNFLIVRLNKTDELNLEPDALPSPEQLSVKESEIVVRPYLHANRYDEALRFVYGQLRRFYDEEVAHGRYNWFYLTYGKHTTLIEPPDTIQTDCAVRIEVENGTERWIIVEDNNPLASRDEFPSTSEIAQRLLGRRVGDSIELPGNVVQPESATIREIQSKYFRAAQDGMQNFRRRFPDSSAMQMVNVGTEDEFDPSAIIKSLEDRREHVEQCLKVYRENPCSLYLLADNLGVNEIEAMQALAHQQDMGVKCCHVTPSEYEQLEQREQPATTIVLDLSAILTITFLNGWQYLNDDKTYLTSQTTSEKVSSWVHDASEKHTEEGGVLGLDDSGNLRLTESSEEQRTKKLEFLQGIEQKINEHCTVRSSTKTASLDPEKRENYQTIIGAHNLETLGVAADANAVLWSDDLVVGFLGKTDFELEHVWTQLAIHHFMNEGSISKADHQLVSAKLAAWGYQAIIWNANTILAAGIETGWDADSWPLKQCIELIEKSTLHDSQKAQIALEFFRLLRRSDCIELKQGAIVRACLDAIGSTAAVSWMLGQIDRVFIIDIPSAEYLRTELQYWLQNRLH